ncbi:TDT family transporter [Vibrio coralliirubri]|uniref:C4-dicarboxylate transporter/malic acid transport protein (Tellurite resistance protein) n=1 Tax=Vibrio coralliirubri TaxID=1516159 RepID=A0AA87BX39_9VIBR|nr:TDT family transporter [Vibrio coralliirubri]MCY9863380.1 TDT family transporter [Vibrio coralliirubri]CDT26712.1 putative C4-dicarboxylate transporter/malic acid transport protein (Tellurite resistance protein) [Vibrio coralliirubri]CDT50867.1 putative C4-dicarboxylate transporter/malic acid transport protein (Tellurite resistance protein) [Vibrio coralliirubri]CDT81126.1 putative C4-dicarboxylate transporter/malic acid transport protein (Tellurite resistance protein) [Vibrio coralliirubri]
MIQRIKYRLTGAPTPMAGLGLAIASLGWSWENVLDCNGYAQWFSAAIGGVLLTILAIKFLVHGHLLRQDLAHPVVGSVVPTFAMGVMVVSSSIGHFYPQAGNVIWLAAVVLHVVFLVSFFYHRAKDFELHHMVPSWFVPPIGIVVADVAFSGEPSLQWIADSVLWFGLASYVVMLPMMIYRLIFTNEVPDAAKPTIAVMAAPASVSLAGYLAVSPEPSPVIIGMLFGIAVLMTSIIYVAFLKLMRLPFSPGYAAFTFPLVISATALFKTADWMESVNVASEYVAQVNGLADIELMIATLVVSYVAIRYYMNYKPHRVLSSVSGKL